jgi:hypothetical protein
MADEQELHPVVQLMLKRMESHPEEFGGEPYTEGGRWGSVLITIQEHGSDAERNAMADSMRVIRLERAHVWALDELCNGEERRKEEERAEQEARVAQIAYTQSLGKISLSQYAQRHQNTAAAAGVLAGSIISLAGGGGGGSSIPSPNIKIGNETLDENMLAKIKRSTGL